MPSAFRYYPTVVTRAMKHWNLASIAMSKRLQIYETAAITVTFDPNLCRHGGACVRGLPAVFDIRRKRWIRPEAATPEEVAAQVARCPSGALQSYWPGEPVPGADRAALDPD